MARKINLGNLKMNSTSPLEEKVFQEEKGNSVGGLKEYEKIKETIQILLIKNNKIVNYTIAEASEVLNISQEFIRRRITAGKIQTINFGDKKMITVFEIAGILCEGVE